MGKTNVRTSEVLALVIAVALVLAFIFTGPARMIADGIAQFTLTPAFLLALFIVAIVGMLAGAFTTATDWMRLVSWSASSAGFGMRPTKNMVGRVRAQRLVNGIASGYNTAIYQYSPVKMVTSSSVNTLQLAGTTDDLYGVFDGVEYTDSNGRRQYSKYWPAGLTPLAGTTWNVYVWSDPTTIFEIQLNAAVTQWGVGLGGAGQQTDFASNIGAGSSVTQLSSAQADQARLSSSAQRQLRIIDKGDYVDNDWGDAFPILQVQIAQHQLIANKVAV